MTSNLNFSINKPDNNTLIIKCSDETLINNIHLSSINIYNNYTYYYINNLQVINNNNQPVIQQTNIPINNSISSDVNSIVDTIIDNFVAPIGEPVIQTIGEPVIQSVGEPVVKITSNDNKIIKKDNIPTVYNVAIEAANHIKSKNEKQVYVKFTKNKIDVIETSEIFTDEEYYYTEYLGSVKNSSIYRVTIANNIILFPQSDKWDKDNLEIVKPDHLKVLYNIICEYLDYNKDNKKYKEYKVPTNERYFYLFNTNKKYTWVYANNYKTLLNKDLRLKITEYAKKNGYDSVEYTNIYFDNTNDIKYVNILAKMI